MTVPVWCVYRKGPVCLCENRADTILLWLNAASCISCFGNIQGGEKQHGWLLTAKGHCMVFYGSTWLGVAKHILKLALLGHDDRRLRWPISFLWSPQAAGRLIMTDPRNVWLLVTSGLERPSCGPASSIKQGQDGRVYETSIDSIK